MFVRSRVEFKIFFILLILMGTHTACDPLPSSSPPQKSEPVSVPEAPAAPAFQAQDTLVMKSGGMISGIIQEEKEGSVLIQIAEGMVGFPKSDIAEIKRGQASVTDKSGVETGFVEDADAAAYPRLYLKNGSIAYGSSLTQENKIFYLKQQVEGGGEISYGFKTEEIEKIRLWPPPQQKNLSPEFLGLRQANMKYAYEKNPYYIISAVEPSDSVLYFSALQRLYDDFLIHFYSLLDVEKSHGGLGVVLFGDYNNFLELAGLPQGTNIMGFYNPADRALRLFNVKETNMVRFLLGAAEGYEQHLGKFKTEIENANVGSGTNKWQVYGEVEKEQHSVEKWRMDLEQRARAMTIHVIRHEATHQLMNVMGLSRTEAYNGAWFSEGLAQFMEPENYGDANLERLMFLRMEAEQGHSLMPLQHLMNFKAGGDVHANMHQSYTPAFYAQSWLFIYYLMNHYTDQFWEYMRELKKQTAEFDAQKDILLLEKHLQKPLSEIEVELEKFVGTLMKNEINEEEFWQFKMQHA